MTTEQLQDEIDYFASLFILKELLAKEIITPSEFGKIQTSLLQKYTPVISSLGD